MTYDPDIHHRRSIRLNDFDYSQSGAYFVTIVIKIRKCLFGEVIDEAMVLNDAGYMVETVWNGLPHQFPNIELDEYVVMPNHFHGIIIIVGATLVVAQQNVVGENERAGTRPAPTNETIGDIIGVFKSITTHEYVVGVKNHD